MRQLFWKKIPTNMLHRTVWHSLSDDRVPLDPQELESVFAKPSTNTNRQLLDGAEKRHKRKPTATTLLDLSRANNVAIMIARIKIPYSAIRAAIIELDESALSVENLRAVSQYVPTLEEMQLLKSYDGDHETLGNAEKYFKEVMTIPRLSPRLSCMIFKRRFELDVEEIKPELIILHQAIEELRKSRRFTALLEIVLGIGNYLNGSSFRGGAYGFQLDALLMLKDVRSQEGNSLGTTTLLHYLAQLLESKRSDLLTFIDELPHIEAAARVSFATVQGSANALVQGLQTVRTEVRTLSNVRNRDPTDRFLIVMNGFVKRADPTIGSLRELATRLEQDLHDLLVYFGEDPATKPEDFFSIIVSFSSALAKACKENEAERAKRAAAATGYSAGRRRSKQADAPAGSADAGANVLNTLAQGDFDDAIRGLRSGLRRKRTMAMHTIRIKQK